MEVNVSAGGPAPPESPKPQPMAFTIEFEGARAGDAARRELLARSQARRQRVQSASGGAHRPSPELAPQKPPMSAKLPRKAQGYNSEGYFSSDQEDSVLSGSVKLKRSPLAQSNDLFKPHNIKSPVFDVKKNNFSNCTIEPIRMNSKSPIVDSIMSRSDTLPSRHGLNLPLKPMHSSSYANMQQSPNYSTLSSSYSKRNVLCDIIDQSPDGLMLTDISSPEMDMLTPENVLSSPEYKVKSPKMDYKSSSPKTDSQMSSSKDCKISSPKADYKISSLKADYKISSPQLDYKISSPRFSPKKEMPDLFKKCVPKNELEILEDCDKHSENSSTGTYTIEGDNYTEEQKARMSIDRTFGVDLLKTSLTEAMQRRSLSKERDPELVLDLSEKTKEYHQRDICLSPLNRTFEKPKVSTEKNVLEIMCCYESPDETDLATQTSNQIKSTRNYLEKIKSRVRTISEKTFQKPPQKSTQPQDEGSFTSVTTSGVLSSKFDLYPEPRRVSLTQSQIDKTDYVHRLTRESSVPVSLPSAKKTYEDPKTIPPFQDNNFESEVLRNAHAKTFKDTTNDDSGILDVTPEQVVGKLSYLSLNRCKGDKTWIQEWADSVKKYNSDALGKTLDLNSTFVLNSSDRPPASPRHQQQVKCATVGRSGHSAAGTLTKIPSPVHSRPVQEILSCNSDTESYLLRTQSAITNLQAKLHTKTTSPISNLPPLMTTSFVSEKTAASRLPVSQLSRSNSLNYRLRKRDNSADSSPLRSPGNYVITGSGIPTSTKLLLAGASRSLDTEPRYPKLDSNMNSPERCTYSNSSDEKTLSNKMYEGHVKTHARHRSFDGHNIGDFIAENDNVLGKVSLKTVLKNNAFEAQRTIEPTRCLGNRAHVRVYSDSPKVVTQMKPLNNTIRRSSSFNTVNRNNNYIEPKFKSTNQSGNINEYAPKDTDYLSDESDSASYPDLVKPQPDLRYNRAMILRRERLESPNLKSIAPANSPRCPNTPEMIRKFGPGLVRNSGRVTNQKALNSRLSEPPRQIDREKTPGQQGRKISDTTRLEIVNRLTKSRSSTRDFGPKNQEKGGKKKPNQHRSSTSLASKEVEFTNWKKRSSYDPMKAAQEGKRRQQQRMQECNKDDLSSPSHSSPVHRSQSFHSTNMADLAALDYSSEETEDDQMVSALPMDHPMISSTHSDILEVRRKSCEHRDAVRRRPVKNDVALTRDYVAHFKINHPPEKLTPHRDRDIDKRKTFIIDDKTPVRDDVDRGTNMENTFTIEHNGRAGEKFRIDKKGECNAREDIGDKRRTFILDSDTNSTTNGSSPRNSSIFSHEKNSLTTTGTSDTEGESGTESAPVVMRKKGTPAQSAKRHSGDYSVSSSTTSASQPRRSIQPRYLDISKYKNESSPKNFLRKDPSKTYIAALGPGHAERAHSVSKSSAREHEMEQKKQELEKWKRRASYDPRKAAALGKSGKTPPKTASSVIRSQSFNGPVLSSSMSRYTAPHQIPETYDQSSDNDF